MNNVTDNETKALVNFARTKEAARQKYYFTITYKFQGGDSENILIAHEGNRNATGSEYLDQLIEEAKTLSLEYLTVKFFNSCDPKNPQSKKPYHTKRISFNPLALAGIPGMINGGDGSLGAIIEKELNIYKKDLELDKLRTENGEMGERIKYLRTQLSKYKHYKANIDKEFEELQKQTEKLKDNSGYHALKGMAAGLFNALGVNESSLSGLLPNFFPKEETKELLGNTEAAASETGEKNNISTVAKNISDWVAEMNDFAKVQKIAEIMGFISENPDHIDLVFDLVKTEKP